MADGQFPRAQEKLILVPYSEDGGKNTLSNAKGSLGKGKHSYTAVLDAALNAYVEKFVLEETDFPSAVSQITDFILKWPEEKRKDKKDWPEVTDARSRTILEDAIKSSLQERYNARDPDLFEFPKPAEARYQNYLERFWKELRENLQGEATSFSNNYYYGKLLNPDEDIPDPQERRQSNSSLIFLLARHYLQGDFPGQNWTDDGSEFSPLLNHIRDKTMENSEFFDKDGNLIASATPIHPDAEAMRLSEEEVAEYTERFLDILRKARENQEFEHLSRELGREFKAIYYPEDWLAYIQEGTPEQQVTTLIRKFLIETDNRFIGADENNLEAAVDSLASDILSNNEFFDNGTLILKEEVVADASASQTFVGLTETDGAEGSLFEGALTTMFEGEFRKALNREASVFDNLEDSLINAFTDPDNPVSKNDLYNLVTIYLQSQFEGWDSSSLIPSSTHQRLHDIRDQLVENIFNNPEFFDAEGNFTFRPAQAEALEEEDTAAPPVKDTSPPQNPILERMNVVFGPQHENSDEARTHSAAKLAETHALHEPQIDGFVDLQSTTNEDNKLAAHKDGLSVKTTITGPLTIEQALANAHVTFGAEASLDRNFTVKINSQLTMHEQAMLIAAFQVVRNNPQYQNIKLDGFKIGNKPLNLDTLSDNMADAISAMKTDMRRAMGGDPDTSMQKTAVHFANGTNPAVAPTEPSKPVSDAPAEAASEEEDAVEEAEEAEAEEAEAEEAEAEEVVADEPQVGTAKLSELGDGLDRDLKQEVLESFVAAHDDRTKRLVAKATRLLDMGLDPSNPQRSFSADQRKQALLMACHNAFIAEGNTAPSAKEIRERAAILENEGAADAVIARHLALSKRASPQSTPNPSSLSRLL